MFTKKRIIGSALCAGVLAAVAFTGSRASADDARLTVTPAVYRTADGDDHGATVQLARWGGGRGWGGGYRGGWGGGYRGGWGGGYRGYGYGGGYRGWGGYGYRPYYGYGYPAVGYGVGYGYPAYGYGYGYPAYGYGGGVGVGIW